MPMKSPAMPSNASSRVCLVVLLAGAALAGADPVVWTPDLAFQVKRVSQVAVSPDGTRVAYVVASAQMEGEKSEWLSQIWVAGAAGSGAQQLTRGEKSSSAPAWSPDGKWLVFVSARGGKPQLWRLPLGGGEAEALTDEKSDPGSPRYSPDGRLVAFLMAEPKTEDEEKAEKEKRDWKVVDENDRPTRVYVVPIEADAAGKRAVRALSPAKANVGDGDGSGDFDWSPDSRQIAFAHQPTTKADDWTRQDVSIVEVASGAVRSLAATAAAESSPLFSPDGASVALVVSDAPPTWATATRVHVVPTWGGFVPDYFGGEYWDVLDRWRTHSAMFNVKGVTTPTLIQHGEADLRVPVSQGYEFYNALKRQGVTTRMVVYPRQPHGLQEPRFVKDAMTRNLEWFDRYVLGKRQMPSP